MRQRNPCPQRLCDGCCLSVGGSVGLALAVLLPLLLPWPSLLGVELQPEHQRLLCGPPTSHVRPARRP